MSTIVPTTYNRIACRLYFKLAILVLYFLAAPLLSHAQSGSDTASVKNGLNYNEPKEYIIGGIKPSGIKYLDPDALISVAGLRMGDRITIPGEAISLGIKKLWDQGLLSDIDISAERFSGDSVFLLMVMKERPRLSRFAFKGVSKGQSTDLREKVGLARGKIVTDAIVKNTINKVRKFFIAKGYFNCGVKVVTIPDSSGRNTITLRIDVDKGNKVKIDKIVIEGNKLESEATIKSKLKETKEINKWRIFKPSRFVASKFDKDKEKLIDWYNKQGYRDAAVMSDSIYKSGKDRVSVVLRLEEGRKYYYRNITWTGNYLYQSGLLGEVLGIRKGDVYNQELMEKKINFNPNGADVSSLYMDDGYLFFRATPTEVAVVGDSIDVEMRIYEGQQATINKVYVEGNTKTSDHVVMREIRTKPGQKFSRSDLIRTNRELAQLGYFDPEQIGILPQPNQSNGTVDIKYTVVEKPSDQIQLSGGWGGYYGFVGTLGLVFNNFSARKIPKFSEWRPLPSGDGQRFSINFQANGRQYQTYSTSFTEPWLGGKRRNTLTIGLSRSVQSSYASTTSTQVIAGLNVTSLNVSLGRSLRWPDDYFSLSHSASIQRYNLFNYNISSDIPSNGSLNQISLVNTLSRNSLNNPIFPTAGSSFTFSVNATPPYSLLGNKAQVVSGASSGTTANVNVSKLVEFHKWMFDGSWFTSIAKNLVINTRAHFGFLGYYSKATGIGPFERFKMGGSGITGFNYLIGYDIIGLRGYVDNSISPTGTGGAGIIYNKYVTEVRYAISTNPAATIFVLGFAEGGNNVGSFKQFNPFNIYRSTGVGVRIMMPAFGLLGVDYGVPLDAGTKGTSNYIGNSFTFTIGQQIR